MSEGKLGVEFPASDEDSAWTGAGALALVTGLVVGVLSRDRQWAVEMPQGYSPSFDLVMRDGRRFRVRLEEVSPGAAAR